MTEDELVLAAVGIQLLRRGVPMTSDQIASAAGIPTDAARTTLQAMGVRVSWDGGDRIVGLCGLSLEPTPHRLRLDGVSLYTWCAYDGVGIPAASGLDATIETRCGHCGRHIAFDMEAGEPPTDSALTGWLPVGLPGRGVRAGFCASANLFCTRGHLEAWLEQYPDADGSVATLAEMAALGASSRVWGGPTATPSLDPDDIS